MAIIKNSQPQVQLPKLLSHPSNTDSRYQAYADIAEDILSSSSSNAAESDDNLFPYDAGNQKDVISVPTLNVVELPGR
jgi:hypothetical protein